MDGKKRTRRYYRDRAGVERRREDHWERRTEGRQCMDTCTAEAALTSKSNCPGSTSCPNAQPSSHPLPSYLLCLKNYFTDGLLQSWENVYLHTDLHTVHSLLAKWIRSCGFNIQSVRITSHCTNSVYVSKTICAYTQRTIVPKFGRRNLLRSTEDGQNTTCEPIIELHFFLLKDRQWLYQDLPKNGIAIWHQLRWSLSKEMLSNTNHSKKWIQFNPIHVIWIAYDITKLLSKQILKNQECSIKLKIRRRLINETANKCETRDFSNQTVRKPLHSKENISVYHSSKITCPSWCQQGRIQGFLWLKVKTTSWFRKSAIGAKF